MDFASTFDIKGFEMVDLTSTSRRFELDQDFDRVSVELIRYATHAPSPLNNQPWKFKFTGSAINVYVAPDQALTVTDPRRRELVISVGAVLDHLEVAMRAYGLLASIKYLPDPRVPDLLAHVRCVGRAACTADEQEIFLQIERRGLVSNFEGGRGVPSTSLDVLSSSVADCGGWMRWIDPGGVRDAVTALVREADENLFASPTFRAEFSEWLRTERYLPENKVSSDGASLSKIIRPLASWLLEHTDVGALEGQADLVKAIASPAFGLLFTYKDEVTDWLDAGRALSQLALRACAMGYECATFDQPMDSHRLRKRIADVLNTACAAQIILRVGPGSSSPNAGRHSPESFLIR